VDLGVQFQLESTGVRLTKISKAAGDAGLRVGDLVRAADGAPLTGLGMGSVRALAFFVTTNRSITWTIERDGATQSVAYKPN
jgi:PDZ domain